MDIILDTTKKILSSFFLVYYRLMLHGIIFFILFVSGNCISMFLEEMARVINFNGGGFFMIMYNG